MNLPYPTINIDDSYLKGLEGLYGTGEAFVRAIKKHVQVSIRNKNFVIFGYEKIGRGVVRYLSRQTENITIVEKDTNQIGLAKQLGHDALNVDEIDKVKQAVGHAFCIVTATGIKGMLSEILKQDDSSCFCCQYGRSR